MKKPLLLILSLLLTMVGFAQKEYFYQTVPNDPLKARIYTLDNGLKVYLTVNKDQPNIYASIGVKAGRKHKLNGNDFAHYMEAVMMNGTSELGALNWEKEKPLLDEIERVTEQFATTEDSLEREEIYREIGKLSLKASQYANLEEYEMLRNLMGSHGESCNITDDYTCFMDEISSKYLESWVEIQKERFTNPVFRGFHSSLYETYCKTTHLRASAYWHVLQKKIKTLFTRHPYGDRLTVSEVANHHNVSITQTKQFYETYYVPNNMAIALSGNLDFYETIALIDHHFGSWEAKTVPKFHPPVEPAIKEPIEMPTISGWSNLAFLTYRLDFPARSKEVYTLKVISEMLGSPIIGLFDSNGAGIVNSITALAYPMVYSDYSIFSLSATPNNNRAFDQVKDCLLDQIELIQKGEFSDELLISAISCMKNENNWNLLGNQYRAQMMIRSYLLDVPWERASQCYENYDNVSRQDVINFANRYLQNNYATLYQDNEHKSWEEEKQLPELTEVPSAKKTSDYFKKFKKSH